MTASPIRQIFHLTRPDIRTAMKEFKRNLADMKSLRHELTELQTEVRQSLHNLQKNLEASLPEPESLPPRKFTNPR